MVYPLNQFGLMRMAIHIAPNMHASTAMLKTLNASKAATMRAYVQQLTQEQDKFIQTQLRMGSAGWANDPTDKQRMYLVQKGTGLRIMGMDGVLITRPGQRKYPKIPFPETTYFAALSSRAFEDTILHMYLDSGGQVTAGIGELLEDENDALKVHNSVLPFYDPSGHKATDNQVRAEYQSVQTRGTNIEQENESLRAANALLNLQGQTVQNQARDNPYLGYRAGHYQSVTSLQVKEEDAMTTAKASLQRELGHFFSTGNMSRTFFDTLPEGMQMTIADHAFNMHGITFSNLYKKFLFAVSYKDWEAAKLEINQSYPNARKTKVEGWIDMDLLVSDGFYIKVLPQSTTLFKGGLILQLSGKYKNINITR